MRLKRKFQYLVLAGVLPLFTACGGGSASEETASEKDTITLNGQVADGYLAYARVCLDLNSDRVCGVDEPTTQTDSSGSFSLTVIPEEASAVVLVEVIQGQTIDLDDGRTVSKSYSLTAPAGSTFVSPLTTLVQQQMEANPSLSYEQVKKRVDDILGVDASVDYIEAKAIDATGVYNQAHKIAQVIAEILADNVGEKTEPETLLAVAIKIFDNLKQIKGDVEALGDDFNADQYAQENKNEYSVLPSEPVDRTAPTITLLGKAFVTVELGKAYTDAGATASDNKDGNITAQIVTVNPVNTGMIGVYTVTYNVSDMAGNSAAQVTRTVHVVEPADASAPVITLLGDSSVTLELGQTYTDAGATASDNKDGNITAQIVTVNPVNTGTIGVYTVTYNVSDMAGNSAAQVTRTVRVVEPADATVPVITLLGDSSVTLELGQTYTDAGATASDNKDGNITAQIVTVNPVNTGTIGVYTVTYNVSDMAGNSAAQVTRTVHVVEPADTTAPVITLLGESSVTLELGQAYTDAGATASDNKDGDITGQITVVNPVDINTVGRYVVTYDVRDAAGNLAEQVSRIVNVIEAAKPENWGSNWDEMHWS
ncbi:DUF5011 domain-containing protein [Thiomicrorhabdus indica]|uniref:DUF5011 domain-containing protein n=1 Tax=Thiomicrorhabdus indica TaxID=2267253 RepID=UPI002AA834FF|nr:DUF5011 domain-containing protein [Thiomicrorhabdus indica]